MKAPLSLGPHGGRMRTWMEARVYASILRALILVSTLLLLGESAVCEDFSLTFNGVGPFTVRTSLTFEGRGERLIAKAKNESGEGIPYARFCVVSTAFKGCLFELWNTSQWEPGEELEWNVTAQRRVPNLAHEVKLVSVNTNRPVVPSKGQLSDPSKSRSLAGFQYIQVVPPTYDSGRTDIYGISRNLEDQLSRDPSWIVLRSLDDLGKDRDKLSRALLVTITHTLSGQVRLEFFDVVGNRLQVVDASANSAWTGNPDFRRAVEAAVKRLREIRPRFDSTETVNLVDLFKDLEHFEMREPEFQRYLLENKGSLSPIEGIWLEQEGEYRLGIIRSKELATRYIGFVLESKHPLWDPGMVKARLDQTAFGGTFVARYYLGDHTELGSTAKLEPGTLTFPLRHRGAETTSTFIKLEAAGISTTENPGSSAGRQLVSTGTGFVCQRDLLVTNYHVIMRGTAWEAVFPSADSSFNLELVLADKANDLALLRIVSRLTGTKAVGRPLAILDSRSARIGEDVYTIGFPLGDLLGSSHKVAAGTLSATKGIDDDPRMFQLSVPSQPGNSGGPIINARGGVIGILSSSLSVEFLYRSQRAIPQNINFALKGDYVLSLLQNIPAGPEEEALLPASLSRAEQIAILQDSIGEVRAFK